MKIGQVGLCGLRRPQDFTVLAAHDTFGDTPLKRRIKLSLLVALKLAMIFWEDQRKQMISDVRHSS